MDEALALVQQLAPEQPELPLWDDKIHADAEKGIAWKFVGGYRVVVSLEDVDLLARPLVVYTALRASRPGVSRVDAVLVQWGRGRRKSLGRLVLERKLGRAIAVGYTCDHENRDHADNRRENVTEATPSQQARNRRAHGRSKYLFVYPTKTKWRASMRGANGKTVHIGSFDTEVEAARAGDVAAVRLHGADVRTNVSLGLLPPLEQQGELAL